MPTISVIIPVYNVEKYIKKCVDSVLGQTYADLEIFLVDDGSPDNCPAICDKYAEKDSRVKVIHKPNGGLSDARNAALDVMTGQYVTFVDSDDFIAPDAIETLYAALLRHNADIAVGNMKGVNEAGEISDFYTPAAEETVLTGEEILSTLNQPCAQNRLYKKDIFAELRYPKGRLYEDVFIYHGILAQTKKMVFTGTTVYYYLIRSGSIMHGEYNIRFTDIIDAIKSRYEWLDSIGQTKLADEARLFIYSRVAVAYAHLDKNDATHKKRLEEITEIYNECYAVLMKSPDIGAKQKIRLILLKYCPRLHTELFGKKMPLVLG